MNSFSEKKFLGLDAGHRSRKLAALLKRFLLEPDYTLLDEYDRLQALADDGPQLRNRERRAIYDAYVEQRRRGGLGPERSVSTALIARTVYGDGGDRDEALAAAIPYEVLLHNIRSGHNTGSILRTADAFGFRRVHLSGYSPGPEHDAVRAAALGAESWVPVSHHEDAARAVEAYRAAHPGAKIIALEATPHALEIDEFEWPPEALIVPGNEELGVPETLLDLADHIVRIPMYGRKASLNVANAFAVAAHAVRRSLERARVATVSLRIEPIGTFHCNLHFRQDAPRQGSLNSGDDTGLLRLFAGRNFEQALRDLDGFERIWLIYEFHANADDGWRPTAQPPRAGVGRVGLFASRSPYRPSRLGLSCVELVNITGREVTVRGFDLLDGTPVYDIKPYIPYADAFPGSRAGWTDGPAEERFTVEFTPDAAERASWIRKQSGLDLAAFARTQLSAFPTDASRKRVTNAGDESYVIAHRTWRLGFHVRGQAVAVDGVWSGYDAEELTAPEDVYADKDVHRAFQQRFARED